MINIVFQQDLGTQLRDRHRDRPGERWYRKTFLKESQQGTWDGVRNMESV